MEELLIFAALSSPYLTAGLEEMYVRVAEIVDKHMKREERVEDEGIISATT